MKLLLDSHALIWAVDLPAQLGVNADAAIRNVNNELLVSAATIWEVAIKCGRGKLSFAQPYRFWMTKAIASLGATILPISIEYADRQASLANHHGDPFDRLLIAQAIVEKVSIVSRDSVFDLYGVTRVW